MTHSIDAALASRIAALIPDGHHDLWLSLSTAMAGAPLADVHSALQEAYLQDMKDRDLGATCRACGIVLAELTPPAARGLSEVAQIVGEVSVVAGAVRWTAAAIGQQIQRVRDARRQEREGAVERTDLIELY